jgi:hypothetical protein
MKMHQILQPEIWISSYPTIVTEVSTVVNTFTAVALTSSTLKLPRVPYGTGHTVDIGLETLRGDSEE